jgi:hypothetical protein
MQEVPTASPTPGVDATEQLQKADEDHHKALGNLGQIASGPMGHEVHADASGVVLTPKEVEDVRQGQERQAA